VVFAVACGGGSEGGSAAAAGTTGGGDDAGVYVAPKPDAATTPDDPIDPNYPSAHAKPKTVDYQGGRVLKAPKVVTITWSGDPLQDRVQEFGDTITQTPYWTVLNEYCDKNGGCVGAGTSGGHVVMTTDAAAQYTDSSRGDASTIQDFVKAQVAAGTFPAPDENTLYAIYLPQATTVVLDGDPSCQTFGAYHNTVSLTPPGAASPMNVAYAILPRCSTSERELTVSASHEFAEAATDPDIGVGQIGFYLEDPVWGPAGGEVGDLCEFGGGNSAWNESTFAVQRVWSNKSALAGHNPCVPIPEGQVYFNVAPAADKAQITLAVGKSQTIELDAFSDAPMTDWQISAIDLSRYTGGTTSLSFQLDRPSAHNGSKPKLTITLTSSPPAGEAAYYVISKDGNGNRHSWPGVVYEK
jgi:hypothetical protein